MEGGEGMNGVSCRNLEEGPRGSPFLSFVEIFHETLIRSNIDQFLGNQAFNEVIRTSVIEEEYYLWSN